MKIKTYNDEHCQRKRHVQSCIFNTTAGLKSSAVVLLGPSFETYIQNLIKNVVSSKNEKVYSYENNWENYKIQIDLLNKLPNVLKKKIVPNFGNIENAEPTRFMEIDLMCTLVYGEKIITKLFQKQYNKYKDVKENKAFSFTLCTRACHPNKTIDFLQKLLNIKILKQFLAHNQFGIERSFLTNSKKFVIKSWSYRDQNSTPMIVVLIQY